MAKAKVGTTDRKLLQQVAALWDHPAWSRFFTLYNPLVKTWCAAYRLDSESVDELRQRVWVELARRMPTYQYDPGGSFRGWLRRLCHHRAIDMIRERRDRFVDVLGDIDLIDQRWMAAEKAVFQLDADEVPAVRLHLLREALDAQEEVRRKVKPERWEVFWRVVIQGEPMRAVATALGLKYTTVYAGVNHVADLLRAEGRRRAARLGLVDSSKLEGA